MKKIIAYIVMLVSIPFLCSLTIAVTHFQPFLMPPPEMTWKAIVENADLFARHIGITLIEAMVGYAIANAIALFFAIIFLYVPIIEAFVTPWMVLIRSVPFIVFATIIVIIFGQSIWPKIIIVVLISFFPLVANLQAGLNDVDNALLDQMRVRNASRWEVFRYVRWPACLPYYMAAHESAFTISIIGAIVAEWLFPTEGFGYLLLTSMNQYRTDRVYALTLIASVLAISSYILVKVMEKRMFAWKEKGTK